MPIGDEAINVFMNMPGEDPVLELTYNHGVDSYELGTGYNHIALAVEDLEGTLEGLVKEGIEPEKPPYRPGGRTEGPRICNSPEWPSSRACPPSSTMRISIPGVGRPTDPNRTDSASSRRVLRPMNNSVMPHICMTLPAGIRSCSVRASCGAQVEPEIAAKRSDDKSA